MKGLYSALLVPFDNEGNIIESGLRQIIRQNIDVQNIDGLYVNGSSGENFLMNTDQKKRVFEIAKDEAGNDIKLIAQVGALDLTEAIELGKFATSLGYDALSAVTPFYYPFSFEEIKYYYNAIIEATGNDMIIYSIPALTGVNLSIQQFDELFENKKIIGVKYTAADFFLLERIRKAFPDKLILSGFDEMLIQAAVSGVDGAIGSTYNINGRRARQIFELAKQGNIEEAYKIQHETNDIIEQVLALGIYPTLKAVLSTKGIEAGVVKRPLSPLNDDGLEQVKLLVSKYNL
ncbi:N-acetylneuraminate lyase [Mammaliicoccus stepanovicii]|uniref:N-acetylneuraminate lyase n=1 Tax=Mammaliicoccus stepanovicii TaxID=643214 RepID=A0A239YJV3_9STAP|nr:N-acetylneuraminate lyase [Mammaliicoccus stepanovicii]PNZ77873.1 N-acetylneuraminate lyase [Mammaliicoccus stepanovicii]GGI40919.1 N-acetylneuraminate lyase [Mammaliicoccus stepanovicii]SNV58693.1 N-acetylneuraminate lyase [Mammaliicoccus stepanovicii]